MGEVSVKVAGRAYRLLCDDGEEARLTELAARVDAEAAQFKGGGAVSEAQLLLMTALMLADKLEEAQADAAAPDEVEGQLGMFGVEIADQAVAALTEAAERIEAIVGGAAAETAPRAKPAKDGRRAKSKTAAAERDLLAWITPHHENAESAEEPQAEPSEDAAVERDEEAERLARQAARRERLSRLSDDED